MNRDSVDGLTTRRSFLRAGAGTIAATAMTETTLAYEGDDRETPVVIKRDDYGVAHIYARGADDRAPVFFGYGHAAAEDRLFQLELYRRFSRGTVSEVLGSDWVDFDKQARRNRSGANLREQIDTHLEDTDR
jgi:penicillin amidase